MAVQAVLGHAGSRGNRLARRRGRPLRRLWLLWAAVDAALWRRLFREVKFTQVTPTIGVLPREERLIITAICLLFFQQIREDSLTEGKYVSAKYDRIAQEQSP